MPRLDEPRRVTSGSVLIFNCCSFSAERRFRAAASTLQQVTTCPDILLTRHVLVRPNRLTAHSHPFMRFFKPFAQGVLPLGRAEAFVDGLFSIILILARLMVVPVSAANLVVTNDLVLEKGATLDARLVVRASHITIEGNGATLQGPGAIGDTNTLERAGVGVLLEGCVNVTIRDLKARGFATGLLARDCW